jgi:hypothetical protein
VTRAIFIEIILQTHLRDDSAGKVWQVKRLEMDGLSVGFPRLKKILTTTVKEITDTQTNFIHSKDRMNW